MKGFPTMKVKLLGIRNLDFTGSNGNQVKGTNLYIAFPEDGVQGHAIDKVFIKPEINLPDGLKAGNHVQLFYNRRGKVEAVVAAE